MTSRRIPLANNPNAANSPFRNVAPVGGKRTRAQAADARELVYGQPPAKKQILDAEGDENNEARQFTRQTLSQQEAEGKVFMKRSGNAPPTAFEKKLAAAREKKPAPPRSIEKTQRTTDSLDTIRQWQKHYRKVFPQFVFYFESVPDDVRSKASRQIHYLGAKEEKFFSKSVTHVVTTRAIPPELHHTSPDDVHSTSSRHDQSAAESTAPKTIDPSLLARHQEANIHGAQRRTANLLEATLQRRAHNGAATSLHDVDPRRHASQTTDILTKARELGIKIWALEKFQRMMSTMFNTETGEQPNGPLTRSHAITSLKQPKEAELQQLLRNEKLNGPADRDMAVATQDTCPLRGYYIYVHDMDEKTRPVMVRDYTKVAVKEEGKWPQFRLSSIGRCPFIEDHSHTRKLREEERRQAAMERERKIAEHAPRTRAQAAALGGANPEQGALTERQANMRRSPRKLSMDKDAAKPLDPPKGIPSKRTNSIDSMPPLFGSAQANVRGMPRYVGGEPVASGVQPSNITSAIRSQIVSSNAISSTAPGARMGTSKEIHALKRKVLERGTSVASNHTITSSYLNDMRAALNGEAPPATRAAKRKAQETLGGINEEEEDDSRRRKAQPPRKKAAVERELKPGYCENCRDKFDDFDQHILSRKHRKFALSPENWSELDALLGKLERPLKTQHISSEG